MWLFFDGGFLSIVQKPGKKDLCVRARVARDLGAFRCRYCPELSATSTTGGSDYPFRGWASHEAIARAVAEAIRDIAYSNFKDRIAVTQGKTRAANYCRVWHALLALESESEPTRAKSPPAKQRRPAPSRKRKSVGLDDASDTREGG